MKNIFNIRIPSIVGIVLLLIGVGATSYLVDQGVILEGRATPDKEPKNIAITNVTPTSFSVLYTTQEPVPGSLQYGTDEESTEVAMDDRDQQTGQTNEYTTHHITVKNLNPNTTYYFSILSGDTVYLNDEEPYEIKTAPELSGSPPARSPIKGSVLFPDETEKEDLLVLLNSDGLQPLSAVVEQDGSYELPASTLRKEDLSTYASLVSAAVLSLQVLSHDDESSIRVLYSNTDPVPLVTFGQAYDFTISTQPIASMNEEASGSAEVSFPETDESSDGDPVIQILTPEEKETFTDQQPLFTGTALPGEEIEVIIHSEGPVEAVITADTQGEWKFRPETPLEPGQHTVTIKTRDVSGTLREFTRSFTVFAQGSQFIEPSVSPTKKPSPTLAAATPTEAPVNRTPATPTPEEVEATPTLEVTPTTQIFSSPAPTRPPLEATGSREVALGGILGVGTIVIGIVLFLITRGSLL
jgi:hypothetical protein